MLMCFVSPTPLHFTAMLMGRWGQKENGYRPIDMAKNIGAERYKILAKSQNQSINLESVHGEGNGGRVPHTWLT